MPQTDLLLGRFRLTELVTDVGSHEVVRAVDPDIPGRTLVLAVFTRCDLADREARQLELVASPAVPRVVDRLHHQGGATALVLVGSGEAPLAAAGTSSASRSAPNGLERAVPLDECPFPPTAVRSALGRLLSSLAHAHSRGVCHGRIGRPHVLAAADGRCWVLGWGAARAIRSDLAGGESQDIRADLQALGVLFRSLVDRLCTPSGDPPPGIDADLVRVVDQLAAADTRGTYRDAAEALADLGAPDETILDAWHRVPFVGRGDLLALAMQYFQDLGDDPDTGRAHVASLDLIGPAGSGKSRTLLEIAAGIRAAGGFVFSTRGDEDGGWSGVGSLIRQVSRHVEQPDDELTASLEALDEILDRRPTPESRALMQDERERSELAHVVTAAANDVIQNVFGRVTGALLLDDADALPAMARELWLAIGRFVYELRNAGRPIRVLLISTSKSAQRIEPGTRREQAHLEEWSRDEIQDLCGAALRGPEIELGFPTELHRLVGGRPRDVILYLRELERSGALQRRREGWAFTSPPRTPDTWTRQVRDTVRAALERLGPDARSLVEALAVSGSFAADRSLLARLTGLSGPRLNASAEAALCEGLIRRSGATWRPRTESIRARVLRTISDERRTSLHRELFVHLRGLPDPAPEIVAPHARGCFDATAGEWTRAALTALTARRRYDEAIEHIREAQLQLDAPFWATQRTLELANLLRVSGRIGEAIDHYRTYTTDPHATAEGAADACLALVQSLYEAREWDQVVEIPLPIDGGTPECLCQIRLIRAAAYEHLQHVGLSEREMRLARAELPKSEAWSSIGALKLEPRYVREFVSGRLPQALRALGRMKRSISSQPTPETVRLDALAANVLRCLGEYATSINQSRASLSNVAHGDLRLRSVRPMIHTCLALSYSALGRREECLEQLSLAHYLSASCGMRTLATKMRLRGIEYALDGDRITVGQAEFIGLQVGMLSSWTRREAIEYAMHLSSCLLRLGHLQAVGQVYGRVKAQSLGSLFEMRIAADFASAGLMGHFDLAPICAALGMRKWDPVRVAFELHRLRSWPSLREGGNPGQPMSGSALLVPAYEIRAGALNKSSASPSWGIQDLCEAVQRNSGTAESAELACALLLWSPSSLTLAQRNTVAEACRRAPRNVPPTTEMQLTLAGAVLNLLEGRVSRARRVIQELKALVARLPNYGASRIDRVVCETYKLLFASHALWCTAEEREPKATDTEPRGHESEMPRPASSEVPRPQGVWALDPAAWTHDRIVCAVTGVVEAQSLTEEIVRSGLYEQLMKADSRGVLPAADCVLQLPEHWSAALIVQSADAIEQNCRRKRVAMVTCLSFGELRAHSRELRALVDACDGTLLRLESPVKEEARREQLLLHFIDCDGGSGRELSAAAANEVRRYGWRGGLAEMRQVGMSLSSAPKRIIDLDDLERIGWHFRCGLELGGRLGAGTRAVLEKVREYPDGASIRALEGAGSVPRRTLQRLLARLVKLGVLARHGAGPSTRYRLGPPHKAHGPA